MLEQWSLWPLRRGLSNPVYNSSTQILVYIPEPISKNIRPVAL